MWSWEWTLAQKKINSKHLGRSQARGFNFQFARNYVSLTDHRAVCTRPFSAV